MTLADRWAAAVVALGGDRSAAEETGRQLAERYRTPPRAYHSAGHAAFVAARADELGASLDVRPRAVLALAALAHDVVYDGVPGVDERASATWAVSLLAGCGLPDDVQTQVRRLVEGTTDHRAAADDVLAACLYDADLAVLGGDEDAYDRYAAQVREEYRRLDDDAWRLGRAAALRDLVSREALFTLPAARDQWEVRARRNLARELAGLDANDRL